MFSRSVLSLDFLKQFKRRQGWFLENLNFKRVSNIASAAMHYALKSERLHSLPIAVKIDISPLCNLHCTICIHAKSKSNPYLGQQHFHAGQKMSVQQFTAIINQIKGACSAVSLYYLGDPLLHPQLEDMCQIAFSAGLMVHVSSNFSLPLSDERLKAFVKSGVTHLTVCVDGLSQDTYQKTRVGGQIKLVKNNLERVCAYKREFDRHFPYVEVQYLKYRHNLPELAPAIRYFKAIGVDTVTAYWGYLHNYLDACFGTYEVKGPKEPKILPLCYWPYAAIVIKHNGEVIPCCFHRMADLYPKADSPTIYGNVFHNSIAEIWNSPAYRQSRRLVSDPTRIFKEEELLSDYCYGCAYLFHTNRERLLISGEDQDFDALYQMIDNRPIRRK